MFVQSVSPLGCFWGSEGQRIAFLGPESLGVEVHTDLQLTPEHLVSQPPPPSPSPSASPPQPPMNTDKEQPGAIISGTWNQHTHTHTQTHTPLFWLKCVWVTAPLSICYWTRRDFYSSDSFLDHCRMVKGVILLWEHVDPFSVPQACSRQSCLVLPWLSKMTQMHQKCCVGQGEMASRDQQGAIEDPSLLVHDTTFLQVWPHLWEGSTWGRSSDDNKASGVPLQGPEDSRLRQESFSQTGSCHSKLSLTVCFGGNLKSR